MSADRDRHNERAVEDDFNGRMQEIASENDCAFRPFSLGGQDREFNADYILAGVDEFAIVEFKFSEKELPTESTKSRSRDLCQRLNTNPRLRELHERGHHAAWRDAVTGELRCNVYRSAICKGNVAGVINADRFCQQFFCPPPPRSLTLDEMIEYLELLESDSGDRIQLYGRKPGTCISLPFKGLQAVQQFLVEYVEAHRPKPSSRYPSPFEP